MSLKHSFYLVLLALVSFCAKSQDLTIGAWREHLSYNAGIALAEAGDKIFCVTRSGTFSYNKRDNSYERLSKITGLNDVGTKTVKYNPYNKTVLIAYQNTNIDLIQNNKITNIPDIKRKPIMGNKTINNISFIHQYAYLSCGFGIVVLDTDKKEIKDTYYIGSNGSSINVRDLASDGKRLIAATDSGIYEANFNDPDLANFNSWKKHETLPTGVYNTVTAYAGRFFTNFSRLLTSNESLKDSIYVFDGNQWSYFNPFFPDSTRYMVSGLRESNDHLVLSMPSNGVAVFDRFLKRLKFIYSYGFTGAVSQDAILDKEGTVWIADNRYGLVKMRDDWNGEPHYPNGPLTSSVKAMTIRENNLWTVPGGVNASWNNLFNVEGISSYIDNTWSTLNGQKDARMDTLYDLITVAIDPRNKDIVYAGSWSKGVLEFHKDSLKFIYDQYNTPLGALTLPGYSSLRVASITFDKENNMWVATGGTAKCLTVRKADGTWKNFDFAKIMSAPSAAMVIVNQFGQKWLILPRNEGILVFDDNDAFSDPDTSNAKKLSTQTGKGALPSNTVLSIAEDLDGEIWIGTDKGLAVFYSPENVFTGANFDAQRIIIEQDGQAQILLENETINAIAVDGANQKWIATQSSGVYLMSSDGTRQIQHFTEENSPLLSNDVSSIAINHQNGEVFFGTAKGIISYRSTATEGLEDFENVYAYPNPVRPDYDGPIAIKGLVQNVNVKITDISGSLVYEMQAEGGQAIWHGKNFRGERVHTGVYLVLCSNEDGSKTYITKILFIN